MGTAVDLDMSERLLEVEVPSDQGEGTMRAYVPCEYHLAPELSVLLRLEHEFPAIIEQASD